MQVTRRRNVFSSILPSPRIRSVRTVRTTNTISPTRKSARQVWAYLAATSAATAPSAMALNRRDTTSWKSSPGRWRQPLRSVGTGFARSLKRPRNRLSQDHRLERFLQPDVVADLLARRGITGQEKHLKVGPGTARQAHRILAR